MLQQIQNTDQAISFVEKYRLAEVTDHYVGCDDTGCLVCEKKPALLRTQQIAKLSAQAFDHISRGKYLVQLYDALESHVNRLCPTPPYPLAYYIRKAVLHLPCAASAGLFATMKKIDSLFTILWLQNDIYTEQDLEDFVSMEEWLDKHRNPSIFRDIVAQCNKTMRQIRDASTLGEFLVMARDNVQKYDLPGCGKVREILVGVLKKKIEAAASQIQNLKADQIAPLVGTIEELGRCFEETKKSLRDHIRKRITSETTLSGLFEIYGFFLKQFHFIRYPYFSFLEEPIEKLGSSQIANADTMEELLKLAGSLKMMKSELHNLREKFKGSIKEKIEKLIYSQNKLECLLEIAKSIGSIKNLLNWSSEFLILRKVEEIVSLQLTGADSLDKLSEVITNSLIPVKSIFCDAIIDAVKPGARIVSICQPEIASAQTLDKLTKVGECIRLFTKKFDLDSSIEQLFSELRAQKNRVYAEEVLAARTISRLEVLNKQASLDPDLDTVDKFHVQNSITERNRIVKESLKEIAGSEFGQIF